jgi:hypothetical protein
LARSRRRSRTRCGAIKPMNDGARHRGGGSDQQ